jgi:hypothetical protein
MSSLWSACSGWLVPMLRDLFWSAALVDMSVPPTHVFAPEPKALNPPRFLQLMTPET